MKEEQTTQHNGQKKNEKRTSNDPQNITQKTKDRVTRTPLKSRGELNLMLVSWAQSSAIIVVMRSYK